VRFQALSSPVFPLSNINNTTIDQLHATLIAHCQVSSRASDMANDHDILLNHLQGVFWSELSTAFVTVSHNGHLWRHFCCSC